MISITESPLQPLPSLLFVAMVREVPGRVVVSILSYILYLFACVCVPCGGQRNLRESVLLSHHVPRDRAQVGRPGSNHVYPRTFSRVLHLLIESLLWSCRSVHLIICCEPQTGVLRFHYLGCGEGGVSHGFQARPSFELEPGFKAEARGDSQWEGGVLV